MGSNPVSHPIHIEDSYNGSTSPLQGEGSGSIPLSSTKNMCYTIYEEKRKDVDP